MCVCVLTGVFIGVEDIRVDCGYQINSKTCFELFGVRIKCTRSTTPIFSKIVSWAVANSAKVIFAEWITQYNIIGYYICIGEINAKWDWGGPRTVCQLWYTAYIPILNRNSVTNLGHLLTRFLEHLVVVLNAFCQWLGPPEWHLPSVT